MLRHMCRGMNRFKVFTLCLSPETSPLVSRRWEHPLGKLCSHTWFRVCFPVSAWAQRWDSPCPSVRCGREMPGSAHAGLQTCCSWLGLGNSPAGPCYKPLCKPCLCCAGSAPTVKPGQTSNLTPLSTVSQSLPSKVVPIFACIME